MILERWIEITILVSPEDVEAASWMLSEITGEGIAIEPQIQRLDSRDFGYVELDEPVAVRGYVESTSATQTYSMVESFLEKIEFAGMSPVTMFHELDSDDWSEKWKCFYTIEHVGKRIVIQPSWLDYEAQVGDIVLNLDPGAAFGTGQHETTQLCLSAIEDQVQAGSSMIDVGCGSGILAIAAVKLGAAKVYALDIDPEAIRVTENNALTNGVSEQITACVGALRRAPLLMGDARNMDLVVVNISSATVLDLLSMLSKVLSSNGRAIVSGFLERDVYEVEEVARRFGLSKLEMHTQGDWACLVLTVNPAPV